MTGLYIHIPFCLSRCKYCDFYKLTPQEGGNVALFLQCLEIELQRLPSAFSPETVFIGGGTPTALEPENLTTLFECINQSIDLSNVIEFSSEANPGTLTPEKLAIMKAGGVNRVSIGVQSFNDKALRLLGRIHNTKEAVEGYHLVRNAGFENVNIDLIQSIPGMNPQDILDDARMAINLGPEHISYYNLIYEQGTPITKERDEGRIAPPGEDDEADHYFAVKSILEEAHYGHYEISNFCTPSHECKHNLLYWQGGEYLGCGPSAHSHWKGARFGNIQNLQSYCDRLLRNENPFDELERLPAEDKARETLVMWMRLLRGVDKKAFYELTGSEVDALCGQSIREMEEESLLQQFENHVALTKQALFISNSVLSEWV